MRLLSTRIPKSKTDAMVCFGEHTPRACGFRRRAENIVRQTFPFWKFPEACVAKVRARRPNSHAGRARSPFLFRNSGSMLIHIAVRGSVLIRGSERELSQLAAGVAWRAIGKHGHVPSPSDTLRFETNRAPSN